MTSKQRVKLSPDSLAQWEHVWLGLGVPRETKVESGGGYIYFNSGLPRLMPLTWTCFGENDVGSMNETFTSPSGSVGTRMNWTGSYWEYLGGPRFESDSDHFFNSCLPRIMLRTSTCVGEHDVETMTETFTRCSVRARLTLTWSTTVI